MWGKIIYLVNSIFFWYSMQGRTCLEWDSASERATWLLNAFENLQSISKSCGLFCKTKACMDVIVIDAARTYFKIDLLLAWGIYTKESGGWQRLHVRLFLILLLACLSLLRFYSTCLSVCLLFFIVLWGKDLVPWAASMWVPCSHGNWNVAHCSQHFPTWLYTSIVLPRIGLS